MKLRTRGNCICMNVDFEIVNVRHFSCLHDTPASNYHEQHRCNKLYFKICDIFVIELVLRGLVDSLSNCNC